MENQTTAHGESKRHFSRISIDGQVELHSDEQAWNCSLIDVSLKGALIESTEQCSIGVGDLCNIRITTEDGQFSITMDVQCVHQEKGRLGFRCIHIDLDSISYLRRIVELNLGDPLQLEREFSELLQQPPL